MPRLSASVNSAWRSIHVFQPPVAIERHNEPRRSGWLCQSSGLRASHRSRPAPHWPWRWASRRSPRRQTQSRSGELAPRTRATHPARGCPQAFSWRRRNLDSGCRWRCSRQAGFAQTFLDAVRRNAAPDILVFDNFGVMQGIKTELGSFEGIGQEATSRRDLIQVTGAFDELLGPARGWTYLFSSSPNHEAARTLALRTPGCPGGSAAANLQGELTELVPKLARAYLEGDAISIQAVLGCRSTRDRSVQTRHSQRRNRPAVWNLGQFASGVRVAQRVVPGRETRGRRHPGSPADDDRPHACPDRASETILAMAVARRRARPGHQRNIRRPAAIDGGRFEGP